MLTSGSYPSIVKHPMDLQTIEAKLNSGIYANRQDFVRDMKLIVSNCLLYNGAASMMGTAGKKFDSLFTTRKLSSDQMHSA